MQTLILTACATGDEHGEGQSAHHDCDPLRHVAGMSLLRRNLLTARHAGAEHVLVISADRDERAEISSTYGEEFADDFELVVAEPEHALEALSEDPVVLVMQAHRVIDKRVGSFLAERVPHPERGWVVSNEPDDGGATLCVHRRALATASCESVQALRTSLDGNGVDLRPIEVDSRFFDIAVVDDESEAEATEALWQSCRKPIDGLTSTYLNRFISLFISRRIVDTRISPNHISILCIMLGLASGLFVLQGTYWSILLGGIALKLNSIIDGVDGELARVRWQYSRTGALLDSTGDNVSNFSFFGAMTAVMFARGADIYGWVGVAMLSMWAVHLFYVYSSLSKSGEGDVLVVRGNVDEVASGFVSKVVDVFRYRVLRRDSFVMLSLLFVIFGAYGPMLVFMSLGAAAVFGNAMVHYALGIKRWLARRTDGAVDGAVDEPLKNA